MDTPDTEGQDSLHAKTSKRGGPKERGDCNTVAARHSKGTGHHNRLVPDLALDVVELSPELANLPPRELAIAILRNVGYSLSETAETLNLSKSRLCEIIHDRGWSTEGGSGLPRLPDDLIRAYRLSKYTRLETLAVDRAIEDLPHASARDAAQIAERAATQLHLCRQPSLADQVSVYDIRAKLSQPNAIKRVTAQQAGSDSQHVA